MKLALQTFSKFKKDLELILREDLFEIIIHGSYVLDDFRANIGDIDFIVLTHTNLDEKTIKSLLSLHKKYRLEKVLLLHQLEGTYYPKFFMESPFLGLYIGTSRMKAINSMKNSFVDLRLVNQSGLKLLGTNCNIYNPTETEILIEQLSDSLAFRKTISQNNSLDIGFWVSLIHASARTLFYRANRVIESKTEACKWCLKQPDLEEFYELFNYTKTLRFPYRKDIIQRHTKTSCIALLDITNVWCNDKSISNIETRGKC